MKLRLVQAAFGAALAALVGAGALAWARAPDAPTHDRYSGDLRRLQALDARLNEQVLAAEAGLSPSYDALSRATRDVRAAERSLLAVPDFLRAGERAELLLRVGDLGVVVEQKLERVEAFKMENAVLRNSVRFFPRAATELAARLDGRPDGGPAAESARALVRDLLLLHLLPPREISPRVEREMAGLASSPATAPERADLDILLRHARVLLERRPRVDALTAEILAAPTTRSAEALEAAYAERHRAALGASDALRSVVVLLALLALGLGVASVMLRLHRTAEREKELRRMKSDFVSAASHELRTPLAVILSSTELLESYGASWGEAKRRQHVARIGAAVKDMTYLLNEVLEIGRLDAERPAFEPAPIDIEALCARAADAAARAEGGGREVAISASGIRGPARVDERLFGHVLTNLLSNALKYSPEGSKVHLDLAEDGADIVIDVRDHGIGIPEADQRSVFETFHRGGNVGAVPGSGLGLAIVRRALDLHGGGIAVSSSVGQGTAVTVRVPHRRGEA